MTPFTDRQAAGRALAQELASLELGDDVLVLGLPRGGVPVAATIAEALHAELDILNVRKLGVPWQPELAMGAIAETGDRYLNKELIDTLAISRGQVDRVIEQESATLNRRSRLFRGGRPLPRIEGRSVILVDDGLATGATMEVAIAALRTLSPATITVAVPVAPKGTVQHFSRIADRCICLREPINFQAVGNWYQRFDQTSDKEVLKLLSDARAGHKKRGH